MEWLPMPIIVNLWLDFLNLNITERLLSKSAPFLLSLSQDP